MGVTKDKNGNLKVEIDEEKDAIERITKDMITAGEGVEVIGVDGGDKLKAGDNSVKITFKDNNAIFEKEIIVHVTGDFKKGEVSVDGGEKKPLEGNVVVTVEGGIDSISPENIKFFDKYGNPDPDVTVEILEGATFDSNGKTTVKVKLTKGNDYKALEKEITVTKASVKFADLTIDGTSLRKKMGS
ncbi:hypothetical protein [Treponema phagedenis]|uniref:hypothetical protein n=1 Tax=Treponema phagedenis TaxID=162 RepID=UPI000308B842|nr:hypothetical protein [Treponema phagedenis]TYT78626.1 hypothetical protein FS559_05550 [Treponema phagedenis]